MAIAFNEIPNTWRLPGAKVEFNNELANQGATLKAYKALIIGQKSADGTAVANELVRISQAEQGVALFGASAQINTGIQAWFKNQGAFIETYALPLDDATNGVQAKANIGVLGVALESGVISLYIDGKRVSIGVTANDTAEQVMNKITNEVNKQTALPCTAETQGGAVKLTAKHKGLIGNDIDLRINLYPLEEKLPNGIQLNITGFAGGLLNPDLEPALASLGDLQFDAIVMPYTDASSLKLMEDELQSRWGAMRAIDGLVFVASTKNFNELNNLGNSRNSPFSVITGLPYSPSNPFAIAAAVAGQAAFAAQNDPARPFQTLELTGILPPQQKHQLLETERNILLFNGISTCRVGAGDKVSIEMLISTYKKGKFGQNDTSYLMINTVWTLSYLRYDWSAFILSRYPRHKLADDGNKFGDGQPIMTPKLMKAEMVSRAKLWQQLGLVENIDQFTADSFAERSPFNPNRLDSLFVPDLVNQMTVFAGKVMFKI